MDKRISNEKLVPGLIVEFFSRKDGYELQTYDEDGLSFYKPSFGIIKDKIQKGNRFFYNVQLFNIDIDHKTSKLSTNVEENVEKSSIKIIYDEDDLENFIIEQHKLKDSYENGSYESKVKNSNGLIIYPDWSVIDLDDHAHMEKFEEFLYEFGDESKMSDDEVFILGYQQGLIRIRSGSGHLFIDLWKLTDKTEEQITQFVEDNYNWPPEKTKLDWSTAGTEEGQYEPLENFKNLKVSITENHDMNVIQMSVTDIKNMKLFELLHTEF